MATTIECTSCRGTFPSKPEYAGRRIRCPKCQNIFRVPADESGEPIVLAQIAPPTPTIVAEAQAPAKPNGQTSGVVIDEWNVPDDFEYTVKEEVHPNQHRCPFCHGAMRAEDVLCMQCGYNRKLGQKMATKSSDEVAAEEEAQAAAHSISFGGFALRYKTLAIAGGAVALVTLLMFLCLPSLLAVLLILGGAVAMFVGAFGVTYVAFQEDTTQGLLTLFMPIYWWVYVFTRWEQAAIPFIVWAIGFGMILAGSMMGWSSLPDAPEAALVWCIALPRAG